MQAIVIEGLARLQNEIVLSKPPTMRFWTLAFGSNLLWTLFSVYDVVDYNIVVSLFKVCYQDWWASDDNVR